MFAAELGNSNMVRSLIEYGASVNPMSGRRTTLPVCVAMADQVWDTVHVIGQYMDLDKFSAEREDQLMRFAIAAAIGRHHVVRELLQKGFRAEDKPSANSPYGYLGNGANPIAADTLSLAIRHERPQVAKILLERDTKSYYKRTRTLEQLLILAITDDACFQLLPDYGADPCYKVQREYLIQQIIEAGFQSTLRILLEQGVPLDIPSSSHGSERSVLASGVNGGIAMLEYLVQNGVGLHPASAEEMQMIMCRAINKRDVKVTNFLLSQGCKVTEGEKLSGLIHFVASNVSGWEGLLDTLLRWGIEINAQDQDGRTCVWIALDRGDLLGRLLQEGAHPLARDKKGETPLLYARQRETNTMPAMVDSVRIILNWLVSHRESISHEDVRQELAQAETEAAVIGNRAIVRLLQRFQCVHFSQG